MIVFARRSMVSVGVGGSISQVNQLVSLFFMLVVQIVITIEWYLSNAPITTIEVQGYPLCNISKNRYFKLWHGYFQEGSERETKGVPCQ